MITAKTREQIVVTWNSARPSLELNVDIMEKNIIKHNNIFVIKSRNFFVTYVLLFTWCLGKPIICKQRFTRKTTRIITPDEIKTINWKKKNNYIYITTTICISIKSSRKKTHKHLSIIIIGKNYKDSCQKWMNNECNVLG